MQSTNHAARQVRASVTWEGDSHEVLKAWPRNVQRDIGLYLLKIQNGETRTLPVRPMQSIGQGVFELKSEDEAAWYRVIYLARIENAIYVLDSFVKKSRKTEKNDLNRARARLSKGKATPPERAERCQAQKRRMSPATSQRATYSKTWDSQRKRSTRWRSNTSFGFPFAHRLTRENSPRPSLPRNFKFTSPTQVCCFAASFRASASRGSCSSLTGCN